MQTTGWCQHTIEFTDRTQAEHVAAGELGPALTAAQDAGLLHGWWYVRKHPYWRLRYLSTDPATTAISDLLDKLAADGRIVGWTRGIYEPETVAFGGEAAMDVAHDLFHYDSRNVLDYLARSETLDLGRRELSVLLTSVLMRAAGQDWSEQGDVWARVAQHRPAEHTAPATGLSSLSAAVHRLMTVNTSPTSTSGDGSPLAAISDWSIAFERAGQQLAELARRGTLERGLRAVLTHHVIFFFNRLGLSYAEQHTLSTLAKEVVMEERDNAASAPETSTSRTSVGDVKTATPQETIAERLRHALADQLRDQGILRAGRVVAALRAVPRHLFVPAVPLEEAYADDAVYTKSDATGTSISAASQPRIVAMMLEQLDAQPGQRLLEAGAGTGYNAALMATIVGESGHVTTIDVDQDLVDDARTHLSSAGINNVDVILGDGALGYPGTAPFDRVIATVSAFETPSAWLKQLAPHGRLVMPLRLRGAASRSIIFERDGDAWRSRGSELAVFMPLRKGIGDDTRRTVTLTPEGDVTLEAHQDQTVDAHTLTGILDTPRHEAWTDVIFAPMISFEWLDLWLACTLDNALMRMSVQRPAVDRGQVSPMFGWGSMATTQDSDLAYLTLRPAPPVDGEKRYEVGVIGHGPTGSDLAQEMANQVRTWEAHYRTRTVRFEIPDTPATAASATGRFVLDRPHHPITVTWE